MRFPKKRYTTGRGVPTNAPSPVSESTDAVESQYAGRKDSERVPAQKPRAAAQTSATPAEPSSSRNRPAATPASSKPDLPSPDDLPDELIAARAYEIWKRRGCPMGQDSERDWHAARAELEAERQGWTEPQPEDRNRI